MDKDWFISQIDACSGMMYRVAWTILRNDADCADALQDAVMKAWEKHSSLRDLSSFKTWVTRILINACYDIQRRNRRTVPLDSVQEQSVSVPDPELAEALGVLPDKLKIPLVLVFSEGMTYEEAAKALHLTAATIRGRIYRARKQLKKELEKE